MIKQIAHFWKSLFLANRFFYLLGAISALFLFSFFYPELLEIANISFLLLFFLLLTDLLVLWHSAKSLHIRRFVPPRLSNGDNNEIVVVIRNEFFFKASIRIIDELPALLQIRDFRFYKILNPGLESEIRYTIRPVERGEYHFDSVRAFVESPLHLASRRITYKSPQMAPCYPSFLHLRKYELLALSNRFEDSGRRRIRSLGQSYEFDHVRNYALGDDIRSINWKATARHDSLMINQYRDERSQQIYCAIDGGRTMKAPFDGMTLLDYAINSTLVLADVAVMKNDKAGLVLFSNSIHSLLPCDNKKSQMSIVMENLYNAETNFNETSFELLASTLIRKIPRRSLIVLFSNFEGRVSLHRQLPFLKKLAAHHLLLTVFFENTLLKDIIREKADTLADVYIKTIAEKQSFERRFMADELSRNGIIPLLTTPENLTVDVVNKYVDIKARKMI